MYSTTTSHSILLQKLRDETVNPEIVMPLDEVYNQIELSYWDWISLQNLFLFSAGFHTVVAFLAPLFAVRKWYRRQSSDSDILAPFIVGGVALALWSRYGLLVDDMKFALLTGFGTVMHIYYMAAHHYYRTTSLQKDRQFRLLVSIMIIVLCLFLYLEQMDIPDAIQRLGTLTTFLQCASASVIIFMILLAIQRKAMDFLQFEPTVLGSLVTLHGVIYGWMRNDTYLSISNIFVFTLNTVLLSLFAIYPLEIAATSKQIHVVPTEKTFETISTNFISTKPMSKRG